MYNCLKKHRRSVSKRVGRVKLHNGMACRDVPLCTASGSQAVGAICVCERAPPRQPTPAGAWAEPSPTKIIRIWDTSSAVRHESAEATQPPVRLPAASSPHPPRLTHPLAFLSTKKEITRQKKLDTAWSERLN
jgi:hypothetical protein